MRLAQSFTFCANKLTWSSHVAGGNDTDSEDVHDVDRMALHSPIIYPRGGSSQRR
jgi:hypothetical protein